MTTLRVIFLLCLLLFSVSWAEPEVKIDVLEQGMGPRLKAGETAVLTYRLELANGTLIETAGIKNPFIFATGSPDVILGLSKGVEGMKVGEKRLLIIPPELAYGSKELGDIPVNSTLHFEVELLEIRSAILEEPEEAEEELSAKFKDENFLNERHATDIQKPAMFEYLIRDFFTKPWRYEDGHLKIWRSTSKVFLCFLLLCGLAVAGHRKQWWLL